MGDILRQAAYQLESTSDSARADAEILLAYCLQKSRTWLFTWSDKEVDHTIVASFKQLLDKRLRGVPIAHLTGQREFWTLNLKVTSDTLIPRPETELLVETALSLLPAPLAGGEAPRSSGWNGLGKGGNKCVSALDLGTGTGAIALSLAHERPDAQFTACDFSAAALAVATENAYNNAIHNVQFIHSNWFSALPSQRFDVIVSNPPYIETHDPHLSQGDVRFEPRSALTSGQDGLDDLHHIITTAPHWLSNGGWLLLEHGYNQGQTVTTLLHNAGFQQVRCLPDLGGNDRVSLGQWRGA